MKPSGIRLTAGAGGIGLHVTRPSRVEDAVWEAVSEAICAGWTPEQFSSECAGAWDETLDESRKDAAKAWARIGGKG